MFQGEEYVLMRATEHALFECLLTSVFLNHLPDVRRDLRASDLAMSLATSIEL